MSKNANIKTKTKKKIENKLLVKSQPKHQNRNWFISFLRNENHQNNKKGKVKNR